MTITRRDSIRIEAPIGRLGDILLDAAHLPEWNPAFTAVTARALSGLVKQSRSGSAGC